MGGGSSRKTRGNRRHSIGDQPLGEKKRKTQGQKARPAGKMQSLKEKSKVRKGKRESVTLKR